MTIASQTSRIAYTGDGVTTAFAVPFYFAANADLVVILQDTLGNQVVQVLGTNYNLTGATLSAGGTCTFTAAPTTGYLVTVYRDPAITQTTSYNNNDPFPAKAHELALDKLTTLVQRLKDLYSRTIHQNDGEPAMAITLPTIPNRKNKLLAFDTNGVPIYVTGPTFVNSTFIGVAEIDSRATAAVTTFPLSVNVIRTNGYATPGDGGGAVYTRGIVSSPGAFQDAGGAYWGLLIGVVATNAAWFGAKGDGITNDTAAIQAAITAAAGSPVALNAGTFVVTAQLTYNTTAGAFVPGLKLAGAGVGKTFIDNRVANASCIVSQSTVGNNFQLGGYVRDMTIKTTTSPVASVGLELKAVYQFRIENVHFIGMTSHGAMITSVTGDPDAANIVLWRNCRFENNGGAGLYCNFTSGITQPSFIRVEDSLFSGNTLCGYYFIGLQGAMINCGFGTNVGPGLWMPYNASSNAQFFAAGNTFENNGGATAPQVRIDSLQGGEFIGTEIASTVIGFPAVTGISLGQTGQQVSANRFEGTRVRVGAAFNPYTLFRLGAVATLNVISNTFWQSYDATGQVRYVVDPGAYGNRMSDSFDSVQVGTDGGTFAITCVNGANQNLALPSGGGAFGLLGPSGAFSIGGLTNAFDGRRVTILNDSGQALTVTHEAGGSTAAQRIWAPGGADLVLSNIKTVSLLYMGGHSRWVVTDHT